MTLLAAELTHLVPVQRRADGRDAGGQPLDTWEQVGELWVGFRGETGMGAIRAGLQDNVPASVARYSLLARFDEVRELGIDEGMRIVHDGEVFAVLGVTRDHQHRDRAYIITEQGGATG